MVRLVTVLEKQKCIVCNGTGKVSGSRCTRCKGKGKVEIEITR